MTFGNAGVELRLQRVVTLAHPDAHAQAQDRGVIGHSALDLAAGPGIGAEEGIHRDAVGLGGVDAARDKILVGLVLGLVQLDFGGAVAEIGLRIVLVDGRHLNADDLARQALRRRA